MCEEFDGEVDRDESTTAKGNRHENEAKAILKRVYGAGVEKVDGWGNHDPFGFVDLIAIKEGEPVKFVQVKTNRFTAEHKRKYRGRTRHLPEEHAEFEVWVRHDRQGWVIHKYRPEAREFEHLHEIPVCDRREAAEEYRDAVDRGELVTDGGVDQSGGGNEQMIRVIIEYKNEELSNETVEVEPQTPTIWKSSPHYHSPSMDIGIHPEDRPANLEIYMSDSVHTPPQDDRWINKAYWDGPMEQGLYFDDEDIPPFGCEIWGRVMFFVEK